jgi:hypothetical protein
MGTAEQDRTQHLKAEGLVDGRSSGLLDAMIDDFLAFATLR